MVKETTSKDGYTAELSEDESATWSSPNGDVEIINGMVNKDSIATRLTLDGPLSIRSSVEQVRPLGFIFNQLGGHLEDNKYIIGEDGTYLLIANLTGVNISLNHGIEIRIRVNDIENARGSATSNELHYPTATAFTPVVLSEGHEIDYVAKCSENTTVQGGRATTSLSIIKL